MMQGVRHMILLGAFCAASGLAFASTTVTFHEEVVVKGPKVMLSDIADVDGEGAPVLVPVEVTTAPVPGSAKTLSVSLLGPRIRTIGKNVEGLEFAGASNITITTSAQTIPRDMVSEQLGMFIESQLPWDPSICEIKIDPIASDIVVPEGEAIIEWQAGQGYRYLGAGTFRGAVKVDGQLQKTLLCRASVEAFADIVVAPGGLTRGQKIKLSDLKTERQAMSLVREPAFKNPAELVGLEVRMSVGPGQVVCKKNITTPFLVRRLQMVLVETRAGGMQIQSQARAQMDGAEGETITCQNIESKQEFRGVVRKDGVVVVE